MQHDNHSVLEVERWLAVELKACAPDGAASGEWTTTSVQAGCSRSTGSYFDGSGVHVGNDGKWCHAAMAAIRIAADRLEANNELPRWNKATVRWSRIDGQVAIAMAFDPDIVPRAPDDPAYEQAAEARRRFWRAVGGVQPAYLAETLAANSYGQTKWFGPHRRVIMVRRPVGVLLATDGLSTPWAGIPDKVNGVECELCLDLANPDRRLGPGLEGVQRWADLLVEMGDRIADGFRIAQDIQENGPMVSFQLGAEWEPATRIVLSLDDAPAVTPARITGLPFGQALLLTATPVTAEDLAGLDLSGEPSAESARTALARHAARRSPNATPPARGPHPTRNGGS